MFNDGGRMKTQTIPPSYDPFVAASDPSIFGPVYTQPNYGKAILTATAVTERGYIASLSYQTRKFLNDTKMVRLARLLESLYYVGFKSGEITANQATELLYPIQPEKPVRVAQLGNNQFTTKKPTKRAVYLRCLRDFDLLALFRASWEPRINQLVFEDLFPEMPVTRNGEKVYYIPAAFVMNDIINPNPVYISIPARALENDKTYRAYIWKTPIADKGKITQKQVDMCKEMNIDKKTMKRYAFMSGVATSPYYTLRKLCRTEIVRLPKNRKEQNASKQWFRTVQDEHKVSAWANLEDIQLRGLDGHLYANKRIGTNFMDETFDSWPVKPTYSQDNLLPKQDIKP